MTVVQFFTIKQAGAPIAAELHPFDEVQRTSEADR
ncbi:hypothetical protein OKW33_003368 [Paraburkholderia atlantica]